MRRRLVIWDVGLGAAANAVAVMEAANTQGWTAELHSFDHSLEPLTFALCHATELGYLEPWGHTIERLLENGSVETGNIRWHFHSGDFCQHVLQPPAPPPDAVLYDPYSPSANPTMWSLEHFTRLRAALSTPCTLTSYSRSTAVRVTLALAGFAIGYGSATGEKDETTVAATERKLLTRPIGAEWLERVSRSTRGAPLRLGENPSPISDADLAELTELIRA